MNDIIQSQNNTNFHSIIKILSRYMMKTKVYTDRIIFIYEKKNWNMDFHIRTQ